MSATMSLSRFSDIHDLNNEEAQVLQLDYRPDLTHSTAYPIVLQSPYIHKECDLTSDILNSNNNRLTFTEFLTDNSEQFINEAYEFTHHQQPHHHHHQQQQQQQQNHHHHHHHQQQQQHGIPPQTTCSSPASDYSLFNYDDTKMIKMEYPESLDSLETAACSYYNMARSLSVDSSCCPELAAVCNPSNLSTSSLSPIHSPLGQSPIMSPCGLPPTPPQHHSQIQNLYHHCEREIPDLLMQSQTPQSLMMQEQEFQSMVTSIPSPASSTKASKSRGRRMSTKPAKPGTKCFECTYSGCGRVFKRSEHLKRHVRSIHTLERPFHCPYPHCSKRFSRSDNLSQHLRVHRPNGKDKHPATRIISNFTPFLQTYHQNGTIHSSIVN